MIERRIPTLAAVAMALAVARAQDGAQDPPAGGAAQPKHHFVRLSYPADKDRVVAEVDGAGITLEQLALHIEKAHCEGFRTFLATDQGQLLLVSNLAAPWVRHFADITALASEARQRGLDLTQLDAALADALKRTFQGWLDDYAAARKARDPEATLDDRQIDRLRADFQMRNGLDCELQGWLDFLEPPDYTVAQLRAYFADHAREFGGMVTFAHILVMHRDAGTGILLEEEGQKRALARMADVKARILPDGSNFREVARLMSEDSRTAPDGGVLRNVERFDRRLPALLTRTAWRLRDGEISDVVETEYGLHLVQRIGFTQQKFLLFTESMYPIVRRNMQESRQEDLLLDVRKRHGVHLLF
ncbi:MAG: hypothetical protein Fur0037_17770 [Planctomycetota bacterium]